MKRPDAYEMEFTGSPHDIIKCENCGFKCLYAQYLTENKCPRCGIKGNVEKGKIKKA